MMIAVAALGHRRGERPFDLLDVPIAIVRHASNSPFGDAWPGKFGTMSPHPDRASVMRRAEGGASAAAPALLAVGFESPRAGLREAEALGFGFSGMAAEGEFVYYPFAALALAKEFEPLFGGRLVRGGSRTTLRYTTFLRLTIGLILVADFTRRT